MDNFIQDEEKEVGQVSTDIYWLYLRSGGYCIFFTSLVFLLLRVGSSVASTFWLQWWPQNVAANPFQHPSWFYVTIYASLNVASSLFLITFLLIIFIFGIRSSEKLHSACLKSMVAAPFSFFDTTPFGRIIARFSTDMTIIDTQLLFNLFQGLQTAASILSVLIWLCIGSPFILVLVPVFVVFYWKLQNYYRRASIGIQRAEALSRAPLYSNFSETILGVATIRAWNAQERFCQINLRRVDRHNSDWFALKYASSWFGLFLAHVGNTLATLCFISIVLIRIFMKDFKTFYDPGLLAATISSAPQLVYNLKLFAQNWTLLETQMNAVERVDQYKKLEKEETMVPAELKLVKRQFSRWPQEGSILFEKVKMRYREDKPLILKGLTANIKGREKIGIVGRTGAGKSSLMQVLFRAVELESGSILIDGQNIAHLPLSVLRRSMSIIPQEPTMFMGTVRYNLDPFSSYNDSEIWHALQLSCLRDYISSLPKGLDHEVSENGSNFSVGQRQLLCMARTVLRKPKILLMDEATASIDLETDQLIQKMIQTSFSESTLLVIAHRLKTVLNLDKIMVLDEGKIIEFDEPRILLSNEDGALAQMVKASGGGGGLFPTETELDKL
eukprot:TRINITY_DN14229_c0_g1_i7.p1 TRINITY_DN14229_c0_g1~~TRINITY_DN14229_c0_g1_i7.p1  ORF type:complete len:614 (+),score=115.29 TRINITY_DN14229_c0_g1_i7:116-1957(+)